MVRAGPRPVKAPDGHDRECADPDKRRTISGVNDELRGTRAGPPSARCGGCPGLPLRDTLRCFAIMGVERLPPMAPQPGRNDYGHRIASKTVHHEQPLWQNYHATA